MNCIMLNYILPIYAVNILGHSTSFLQKLLYVIEKGEVFPLFIDEFRTFLSVRAAVEGIFIALKQLPGVLHLGGRENLSRYEFGHLL